MQETWGEVLPKVHFPIRHQEAQLRLEGEVVEVQVDKAIAPKKPGPNNSYQDLQLNMLFLLLTQNPNLINSSPNNICKAQWKYRSLNKMINNY